ncbi:MAG: hypothetical protein ACKVU1_08405 [bacterium]
MEHRISDEERLLTRFFGTIGLADREHVLGAILTELGVEVARSELARIQVQLWQPYFRATPAVLIEGETTLFFVEGPRDLAASTDRLTAEFDEGMKGSSQFALILITSDAREPEEIVRLRESLAARHKSGRVVWASWGRLYKRVHSLSTVDSLDPVSRRLCVEMCSALEERKLSSFVGFPSGAYEAAVQARVDLRNFLHHAEMFAEEVSAALEVRGVAAFHVDARGQDSPPPLVASHLMWSFRDESWDDFELARCSFYMKLFLESPVVWLGYRLDLSDTARRAFVTEKRGALAAAMEKREDLALILQTGEEIAGISRKVTHGQGGLGFLEGRDALAGVAHADLIVAIPEADLSSAALPALVVERLAWLREEVQGAGLSPKRDTEPAKRFVITNL